jgi:hypothetical protein
MMRRMFLEEGEYKKHWQSSIFWVESDYMKEYHKHQEAMHHIAEFAKMYILENYEKVKDWSELDIKLTHNLDGTRVEFYNHYKKPVPPKEPSEKMKKFLSLVSDEKPKRSDIIQKMLDEAEEANKAKHNPIVTFDKAVLDTSDGDFSVVINGQNFYWINDYPIIEIADYIENELKKQNGEVTEG